jgi:hypothetical protein
MDYRLSAILSKYGGITEGDALRIPCPVHHGKDNNCAVWIDDNDKLGANCFSHGCDATEYLWQEFQPAIKRGKVSKDLKDSARWLKDDPADVFEPMRQFKPHGQKKTYDYTSQFLYTNRDGAPINLVVVRYDNKMEAGDKVTIPYIWAQLADGRKMWIARGPNEPVWYNQRALTKDNIIIVEGEKTCNALQAMVGDKYGVITWQGGSGKYKELDLTPLENKEVVLWPDYDEPGFKWAWKGEHNLYDRLDSGTAVVMWDGAGSGGDAADLEDKASVWDILNGAQSADGLRLAALYQRCLIATDVNMSEDMAKSIPCGVGERCKDCRYNYIPRFINPIDILQEEPVLHSHAYITTEELFVNLDTMQSFNRSGFDTTHASTPGYGMTASTLASRQFWESPGTLQVYEREFMPGQPLMVNGKINLARTVPWTSVDTVPELWLKLGNHLFAQDEMDHILNWLAFTIQYPETKINHTLLICGGQGIGKSLFFTPIERALDRVGQHRTVDSGELSSAFNDFIVNAKLITFEELNLAGGGYSQSNKLKPLQATPPDYLHVNPKFGKKFYHRNVANIVAYSNYDLPIKLEEGQRRWYAVRSTATKLDAEEWYDYDRFNEMLGDDYIDSILSYLSRRQITQFNPAASPPHTAAAIEMEKHSVPGYRDYGEEVAAYEWPDLIDLVQAKRTIESWGHQAPSMTQLRKVVAACGWTNLETMLRLDSGQRVRPWATRRGELYGQMGHGELKQAWRRDRLREL